VTRRLLQALCAAVVAVVIAPASALAQTSVAAPTPASSDTNGVWILAGGGATTLLADCTECETNTYRHTGSVIAGIGVTASRRVDYGAELMWVPSTSSSGDHVRTAFIGATIQFRPWTTRGFFLRGSSGMAFIRNWIITPTIETEASRSKAFALGLTAGWEWRTRGRLGAQVFGAQHVAALGDLSTSTGTVHNVIGNFWTVGAAVIIR